ncbi:hypothetical protein [Allosphingosinicella vermicomposti]|uniref:hypothetical protein n=1 Tax=Allosphingosinicella vermicomposti TaxID=614671 RepID=UPI00131A5B12|nr:hypothetical protein [Allosphingosinicella vermicomposti]
MSEWHESGCDELGELGAGPYHVVQRVPLAKGLGICPVLFVEDARGMVAIHRGALKWARSRFLERNQKGVVDDLRILGRLHDFRRIAWRDDPLPTDDRSTFIGSYLDARYHGTTSNPAWRALAWQPVSYTSVRAEFRSIARYLEFLYKTDAWADEGFLTRDIAELFYNQIKVASSATNSGFFSHLAASRARWNALYGTGYAMPDLGVRDEAGTGSTLSLDRTIELTEAELIIEKEPNPVYRAIWTLGAFGGPRISEMLHMWQCDVLPASTFEHLTGANRGQLFVVIAHPSESTYTGDFSRKGPTRLRYLHDKYGLRPRNHQHGYRKVGWKNPLMMDRKMLFSEVFWSDYRQAHAFAECYAELRHFHSKHNTSRYHPYLFVNLNRGSGFGEPIAYTKAREAFVRACTRVGLEPSISGRRIHGLRHAYKRQLDDLELPKQFIQIALRHRSEASQEDYGKTARAVHELLSKKTSWEAKL